MKKFSKTLAFITAAMFLASGNFASAQSQAVQKAFENVKERLDDLVTAKDEDSLSLELRIETFRKVLSLSITEANDLKLKLFSAENIEENVSAWRDKKIEELKNVLDYYEKEKDNLDDKKIDLGTIKNIADGFKSSREANYLPLADEIKDFLLYYQEQKAVEIAQKRWQKINADLTSLEKAKIIKKPDLRQMLEKAGALIKTGEALNQDAYNLFVSQHIIVASSSPEVIEATSSAVLEPQLISASGTIFLIATSTEMGSSTLPIFQQSIRDLVKDSLTKIKEAYQVFIEMSGLVRKLLS